MVTPPIQVPVKAVARGLCALIVPCPSLYEEGGFVVDVGASRGKIVSMVVNSPDPSVVFHAIPLRMVSGYENWLKIRLYNSDAEEASGDMSAYSVVISYAQGQGYLTANLPTDPPTPPLPLITDLGGVYVGDGMFNATWTPAGSLPCKFQAEIMGWVDCMNGATTTDAGAKTDVGAGPGPPFNIRLVSPDGLTVYSNVFTVT